MLVKEKELIEKLVELGFGVETDEGLLIDELEESYLTEEGIIEGKLIESPAYVIYKDLRNKGYVVRKSGNYLRLFRKGYRRGEDRSKALIKVVDSISSKELSNDIKTALAMKKELVYASIVEGKPFYVGIIKRSFQ